MQDESSNYVSSNVCILTRILKLETQRPQMPYLVSRRTTYFIYVLRVLREK